MNTDNFIQYVCSYIQLRKLVKQYGYTEAECRSVMKKIRAMENDVLWAFLRWIRESKYPAEALHGVFVKALVDLRGMSPIAAFLAADWMAKAPDDAYAIISGGSKDGYSDFHSDDIPDDLKELVAKKEQEVKQAEQDEDRSDFVSNGRKEKG